MFVSAEIIQFTPRPNRLSRPSDFPAMSRSAIQPDNLTMDHADTAPCEYLWPREDGCRESHSEMRADREA